MKELKDTNDSTVDDSTVDDNTNNTYDLVENISIIESKFYSSKISRRESLKWMSSVSAGAAMTVVYPQESEATSTTGLSISDWPKIKLAPITAKGYGKDPKLSSPSIPWPLTLSQSQLNLVAVLADIIIPAEEGVPSASDVGIPDFVNEWISAPYPQQQEHRTLLVPGLLWVDQEALRLFGNHFIEVTPAQQFEIVDSIAFPTTQTPNTLKMPVSFFAGLRQLVVGAFFCSPAGIKDIGYLGNVPITGDYPGPTKEAMAHLEDLLGKLGLSL